VRKSNGKVLCCLFCFLLLCLMLNACDWDNSGCGPESTDEISAGDPGTGPFVLVPDDQVADECGLDPDLLKQADKVIDDDYIVVRYGKLCHQYLTGKTDRPTDAYSATKTLGVVVTGVASYETRDIPRTGRKTGQLLDTDRADHWLDSIGFNDGFTRKYKYGYNPDALLAHVMAMVAHNKTLDDGNMNFLYDVIGTMQINSLSQVVSTAIAQDSARLGSNIEEFTQRFVYQPLGMTDSNWSLYGPENKMYASGWRTTLHDMARIGLLVLHGGIYNGQRLMAESWVYRMTHPSFEESNTGYGYLTWLNTRGGGSGVGGAELDFSGTLQNTEYDLCAPVPMWNSYPHYPSKATDCNHDPGYSCEQKYDVGVWSAQGLGGQYIIGHPGLDLLLVAKDFGEKGGPTGLWEAIRPALVALDPVYKGDEEAFCAAYGTNNYAPDMTYQPMP